MSTDGLERVRVPEGVDVTKALRLAKRIVDWESDNEKTTRLTDSQIVTRISKMIQSEVK